MKICPRCQKTYADDNLNFCLEDGSVLTQASVPPPPSTPGSGAQAPFGVSSGQPGGQTGGQPQWNTGGQQQNYAMQPPKKSSKAWVWVLLILAGVILVCGGGIVGMLYYAGKQAERIASNITNIAGNSNGSFSTRNSNSNSTSNSPTSKRSISRNGPRASRSMGLRSSPTAS